MFEERLKEFSRERLGGRPLPDDLRTMLVAQWEGRTGFRDLLFLTFPEPGEVDMLRDTSYLSEAELADPEMQAICAGMAEMGKYVKLVAKDEENWIGYWLHPDEPADRPAPLVELDTEASFRLLPGRTLAEACVATCSRYLDEPDERLAFTELADDLADLGLPLAQDAYDALREPEPVVRPEDLVEELIDAERQKRGIA
ncbi:hypothetical protein [Actinomadura hibisca]|uniref:hypothetical protein n=1 Tax=Actinomadura hibisca TaxID=68565 RepID=UPI00083246C5|nr:hypothetical protein [Actinomadura hibisca]